MALILSNQLLVLNAYALLVDETPGNTAFVDHQAFIAANGASAYASALNDIFASASTASLATTMLANLGLSSIFTQDQGVAYLTANASNRVGAMLDLGNMLISYSGTDAALLAAQTAYKAAIDSSYAYSNDPANKAGESLDGGTPSTSFDLTAGTDRVVGTSAAEFFTAYLSQNPTAGGVSNTLSSADKVDGGAGADSMYAELVAEFIGSGNANQIDVQPRIKGIETIEFEARDDGGNTTTQNTVTVDAKYITGHDKIGSTFSDGDLVIENLTTLTDAGVARNTEAITVTMDHTDEFNSDNDASDLSVYFDEDYLFAGQTSQAQAWYFLLDEAAELAGNINRLARIDVDGIRFSLDGGTTILELQAPGAQTAGTHAGFVAALQTELAAMIASGVLPAGTTLTVDTTRTDTTGLDNGSISAPIPAILLTIGDGTVVTPIGFSRVAEAIGQYDVYGQFDNDSSVTNLPITVNIDLNKVGREGEGGDLIIGGKELDQDGGAQDEGRGITVFNVNVLGDSSKPSNLGTLDSTNGDLETVNIKTDAAFASGSSFASLTIRDGFGNAGVRIPGQVNIDNDLKTVNANEFKGNLSLGEDVRVLNLDTLNATGGGEVEFFARIDGVEENQVYSYTTGSAADTVDVLIAGDALDFASSEVNVLTGAGQDVVVITTAMTDAQGNQILNEVVLKNVKVDTGADDDYVTFGAGTQGDVTIQTGAGDDMVDTSAGAGRAAWAFNYDDARTGATSLSSTALDNLPGVQTSLAFLNNATVRVTLSGAGLAAAAGGGVMAVNNIDADTNVLADAFADGYEASTTITSLLNGNKYFGDQRDINAAIIKIITGNATLNNLLSVSVSTNNTLVITSNTGGAFNPADLEITLVQKTASTTSLPSFAADVLAEAEIVFKNSLLTMTDLWGTSSPTESSAYVGADNGAGAIDSTTGQAGLTAYYTGLGIDNATLHTGALASTVETDTSINAGAGNDLLVLSTDAIANPVPAFTVSSNNRLLNGASNETVKMTDAAFGNDVVMNFTSDATAAGVDFLDYTTYLTSKESPSGSTASTVNIAVTLAADAVGVAANEVSVVRFDNTDEASETFSNLSGNVIASLFNLTGTTTQLGTNNQFGNLTADGFSVLTNYDDEKTVSTDIDLINGAAKAVVMVENADNLGFYKVYELTWYAGTSIADSTHTVGAVELGSLDFGTTLTGMTSVSLIGSAAQKALTLAGGGVVVPTYAVAAGATSFNEGANATFAVTTTGVADGTVLPYTLSGVTAADVTGGLTGNVTIVGNAGTITVPLVADLTTEGAETLTATVMGASASTTVNDTSLTPAGGRTEVDVADLQTISNAATGAFEFNLPLTGGVKIANVGVFGADDAFDVDNAFLNNANLLFDTTGTTEINMVVGDVGGNFDPSFVVNITTDAAVVASVAAAIAAGADDLADAVAVMGVLNAAWGTDWLV